MSDQGLEKEGGGNCGRLRIINEMVGGSLELGGQIAGVMTGGGMVRNGSQGQRVSGRSGTKAGMVGSSDWRKKDGRIRAKGMVVDGSQGFWRGKWVVGGMVRREWGWRETGVMEEVEWMYSIQRVFI